MRTDVTASFSFDDVKTLRHDPLGDNWLFLVSRSRLMICKNNRLKMDKCKIIVDDVDIEDFVMDVTNGLIFYTTVGRNAGVWRISYQNESIKLSMSKRMLQMPGGLAIDSDSKILYYSDRYFERIFAVDYGNTWTTRSVVHDKRLKYSTSLTYFADYLYVPSRAELLRIDTITSEIEVVDFHAPLLGFFVNHNTTAHQNTAVGGCRSRNGGCSDICVTNENNSAFCLCSDGLRFENGICKSAKSIDYLLLYSRSSPTWIHGVQMSMNDTKITSSIPSILSPKTVAVFTVDPTNEHIYFYEDDKRTIFKRSIHGGNVTTVIENGVHHLTCMAYDSSSGNLYYGTRPNVDTAGIIVFHTKNPDKRARIVKTVGGIHSINVDSMSRFLFYSTTTQLRLNSVMRSNLDGSQRIVLVAFFSFNPITMTIDIEAKKVYWLDPFEYTLHRISYNRENKEKLSISSRTLHSMSVYSGLLFFSDSDGIKRASLKSDGDLNVTLIDSLPPANQLYFHVSKSDKSVLYNSKL
ncbi:hypothetical protein DICVIV_05897 [Dictyocaulus viviparus]|uniref:Low-density lipoprotein receptor repeat class B n=1 Tax=Dictyocaulus viviparus TaxID=29172 RepID=A0A0D8XU03_DICVI|nr:hypothetical protein DICVIV_05897 [Dictyocaulus viviparus]